MNELVLGNNACVGLLVTVTHLEENSSGASWGEGVAVGSRFHSPRGRPLVRQARNSKLRDSDDSRELFKVTLPNLTLLQ